MKKVIANKLKKRKKKINNKMIKKKVKRMKNLNYMQI